MKKQVRFAIKSFLVLCALIAFADRVDACSCMGPRPPCEAYWDASAVFVGTVNFVSTVSGKVAGYESENRVYRFHVDRKFRGVEGNEIEVMTGMGGGDCGYGFRLGGQYLVYAYQDEQNVLWTGICSRTRELTKAVEDLEFIRGLSKAAPGGTVMGQVKMEGTASENRNGMVPVENAKILVAGANKTFEAITDAQGNFKIAGMPPSKYKVRIELPKGLSIYNPEQEIEVHDRGCARASFYLEPDTRITGKVLDSQGLPAADVLMELVPTSRDDGSPDYVKTDKNGRYEMKLVRPGKYLLGVRVAGSAGATWMPYPQTFYPGVPDRSNATIITITEGQQFEANDLVLPPRFIERTLNGIVVDAEGKPVPDAIVWLKENQYQDSDMPYRRETDKDGRFSYTVYEGIKYKLDSYLEKDGKELKRAATVTIVVSSQPELVQLVLK